MIEFCCLGVLSCDVFNGCLDESLCEVICGGFCFGRVCVVVYWFLSTCELLEFARCFGFVDLLFPGYYFWVL